jgi:hypothetical protein
MTDQPFIPVGALGEGFSHDPHVLPASNELAGTSLRLRLPSGTSELRIEQDGTATWSDAKSVPVRVTSLRSGFFLVDGVIPGDAGQRFTSLTFALDVEGGQVTVVRGWLPDAATAAESAFTRVQRGVDPTGVEVTFEHGTVGGDDGGEPEHAPSSELIGLRNRYTYSPREQYEHIYLSDRLYTWHCLDGVERGLADTDRCHTIGLRDRLYLFVWREKIVPTLGLILIDLDQMRTDGKIFGNDQFDLNGVVNFPVGALTEILNVTRYSEE